MRSTVHIMEENSAAHMAWRPTSPAGRLMSMMGWSNAAMSGGKGGDLEAVLTTLFEKQISAFLEQQSIIRQRIQEEQPEQFKKEIAQLHKELERLSSDKVVQYARYQDKKLSCEDFLKLKQQMNKREQKIEQQLKEIQ
ncbi:hypothetical protein [Anaerotruncus rubiinfantis]|uniref:hypothetical protein n=2 Tax=Anaerotruncus rubiinfantis TaxID=1720200 RepID=UPI001FABDE19|nr:hypothetical protein [Anaerotruncus rubiinfantis]